MSLSQISINIRDIYGTRKAYPADTSAEHFARIAGTKTLTVYALREILELGLHIRVMRDGIPAGYIWSPKSELTPCGDGPLARLSDLRLS